MHARPAAPCILICAEVSHLNVAAADDFEAAWRCQQQQQQQLCDLCLSTTYRARLDRAASVILRSKSSYVGVFRGWLGEHCRC